MSWMIYGASGHTGHLVAEEALRRGQRPVLAGRSPERIEPLAARLGLEYRIVDLADPAALRAALEGVEVVAHCAGPFSATSAPMIEACLATGTHYLDITGEIDVFEATYARHAEAERAGVVLLPGAGFDVVPTDCVAAKLAKLVPGAIELDLAFKAEVKLGPGTVKTAIEGAGSGGKARIEGAVRTVPVGHRRITAGFPSGPRMVTAIPWGDVSSAYRSTGIPNITTYTVVPLGGVLGRGHRLAAPLLRSPRVQRVGKTLAERFVQRGAVAKDRRTEVWGQARDAEGNRVTLTLTTPDPIALTADAVLAAVARLAGERRIEPGAHTPSTAFGADFALGLEGVQLSEPVSG
ncbi:saccharopine dehydrogenase family protein [Amycolatopsis cihanbeyliensis]|uniref:Saccharopine dehydrogenase (NAD+, L-lysine-forming) n=1 Tax=Amycolatopsis cihanbeyliensis TaxID=1128664 RepID=A0A542DGH7_AMYCI|nr:saccharopine dehydrogenase NADP-binding domain-containing protein [Amycolatopsis cihanbeyliensis]TQJ02187.1 saccharopine dehydrogenase (NAD+, L-lysine-forming) [Amycolatopsis cihanbeyliensis]